VEIPKKSYKNSKLPNTPEEWAGYVERLYADGLESRKRFEHQWVVNYSYYKGYQNLLYDTYTGIISVPRSQKAPLVVNRMGAWVDARLAKLTKNRPVPRIIPDSNDRGDINAAKYSDQVFLHLWRKLGMEQVRAKTLMQMLLFGTCLRRTFGTRMLVILSRLIKCWTAI